MSNNYVTRDGKTTVYTVHTTYAGNDLIDGEVTVYIVMHDDQAVFASLEVADCYDWIEAEES